MKKLITLFVCLFVLIGLTKADDDKPISFNELPNKSQEFIKQYFAGKDISLTKLEKDFWDKKYEVVFVNGEKAEFDKNGEWEKIDCKFSVVPDSIVPQTIREQVAKQYPQTKILKIERDKKGYEIKLNNKLELKFTLEFKLYDIDD